MSSSRQNAGPVEEIKFASLFGPEHILCHTPLTDRDGVIRALLDVVARDAGLDEAEAQQAYEAVLERERASRTVIAPSIAMPHARLDTISDLLIGVATSPAGIDFDGGHSEPIHLVMLILAPKDNPGLYLQALSSLSKICARGAAAQAVVSLETAEDVWRFFNREGTLLPPYVCAADIMSRDVVRLREYDTLERAVDTLVEHRLVDVPVVDDGGDLVGVVSAYELLRVCLPDYILWMEDLSPVLNFEPFAEVLKKESKTWLTDVMSLDCPTVSGDVPAIQVAKEITRRGARQVYVVAGRKLVGVITLQDFINKVLRE